MTIQQIAKETDEQREAREKAIREKAAQLKKLTIQELQKKLTADMSRAGYVALTLGQPEIARDIRVGFQAQDRRSRPDAESRNTLRKLIEQSLKGTNWRLMTGGVSCRLGILSGRLRGFDDEKDLIGLASRVGG